ncbi:hypothetical protein A4A49_59173, partial [Nicotiana attenuata]
LYITQYPPMQTYPQSWLEMSLYDHALTFMMEVEGQEVILVIQNPVDMAQIVTKGMRMGVDLYSQYLWAMHPPSTMQHLQPYIPLPPMYYNQQTSTELPFYPPQMPSNSIVPWIQQRATLYISSPLHAQAMPYQLTPVRLQNDPLSGLEDITQLEVGADMVENRETRPILCFLNNNKHYDLKEHYARKLIIMCPKDL